MTGTVVANRRDRQRQALVDELCDEARDRLAEGGRAAVSWRGLARAVGMGPASLYTYFDSLDDLFTELILRSYASLAQATGDAAEAFAGASVGDRILVGPLAYRSWALAHRAEFNLVFTDQLPGYVAEPEGPTVAAQVEVFRSVVRPVEDHLGRTLVAVRPEVDDPDVLSMVGLWGQFHGLVSLEVNHHLDWLDAEALYEQRVRWAVAALGLPEASPGVGESFAAWLSG